MPIEFKNVSFIYNDGVSKIHALKSIQASIKKHCLTAIIGHTGCGKSTLIQHLNALIRPTSGEVVIDEFIITNKLKHKSLKPLRKHVGLVFQFSENQLFEETIGKDIAFGPSNFGVDKEEIDRRVKESLIAVGLDESYIDCSCFDLSGGQKRRVAIAGILAMDPEIIVLDEPTAGLDPQGCIEMLELFLHIQKTLNKTIIVVTHDFDQVYQYFDEVILLDQGELIYQGDVLTFFEENSAIEIPKLLQLKQLLRQKGHKISKNARSIKQILMEVSK